MRSRPLPLRCLVAALATASCARFIPPPEPPWSPELAIREQAVRQVAVLRADSLRDSLPLAACSWRRHFGSGGTATGDAPTSDATVPLGAAANDAADGRASPDDAARTLLPPAPAPRFDAPPATAAPCAIPPDVAASLFGYRLPNPPAETWTVDEIRRRGDEVLVRATLHRAHYLRWEAWWFRVAGPPRRGRPPLLEYRGNWISGDHWL